MKILRGEESEEIRQQFLEEVKNPYSEASQWLREVEEWAKKRFPSAGTSPRSDAPPPVSRAKQRLDAVFDFVEQKLKAGVFTMDEVASFGVAGPGGRDFSVPLSPVECNSAATRILKAIEKAHPELKSELGAFRSDRRR